MPLTPNGKIDRRALAALKSDSPAVAAPATPDNDPLQSQLIAIWEELLGVSRSASATISLTWVGTLCWRRA